MLGTGTLSPAPVLPGPLEAPVALILLTGRWSPRWKPHRPGLPLLLLCPHWEPLFLPLVAHPKT